MRSSPTRKHTHTGDGRGRIQGVSRRCRHPRHPRPHRDHEGGVVLDGRQRLRAARELGLESVSVRVVEVADQLDYMRRAAVLRRQLNASQRAALVVEFERYGELRAEGEEAPARQLAPAARISFKSVKSLPI